MLSKFMPGHQFILAAIRLVAVVVALAYLVSGVLALLISVVLCASIWMLRAAVMPSHYGNAKVRLFLLACFFERIQIEIQNAIGSSQRKRLSNLQHAIRSGRDTQGFLFLGAPSSGNNIALHELAQCGPRSLLISAGRKQFRTDLRTMVQR